LPPESLVPVYRRLLLMLGFIIILVAGISSNLEFLHRTESMIEPGTPYMDGITLWENRLSLLSEELPKNGVVGYIADWDVPGYGESSDLETEYRLTQYALAPVVVARGPDYDYVVGNITVVEFDETLQEYFHLTVQREFGYGFLLLRKY
jgi:hypothetical protein